MKKLSLTAIFFIFAVFVNAQPPLTERTDPPPDTVSKERFADKLFFGGNFWVTFGSNQSYVEVAPMIGIKVTERFLTGLSLKYIYWEIHDDYINHSSHVYGGGPFARFFIYEGLFAHVEYELLNLDIPNLYGAGYHRENISSVFGGGGYRQMMGERSAFDILLLYNFNETINSPYVNPIIRIGFTIGL